MVAGDELFALSRIDRDRVEKVVSRVEGVGTPRAREGGERRLFAGETRGGLNISGGALLDMGVVWADDYVNADGLYQCRLPLYPAVTRFGVLTSGSADGAECEFLYQGVATVLVDPAEIANVKVGGYLGLKASSQLAIPAMLPWMIVLVKIPTGTPRAIVEIRRDGGRV